MSRPRRIAVLASGRGSNLQALLDAIAAQRLDADIVGVFSDKPGAKALHRVPAALRWARDAKAYPERARFDADLADAVAATHPDWVVCAGYLRILGAPFLQRFRGRVLNIHPSLLPAYRGLHTHSRVIAAEEVMHGASVHFVIPELDAGAVITQASVRVLAGDTPESLAARVLRVEHPLLLATLQMAVAGRIAEQDGEATMDGQPLFTPLALEFSVT